MATANSTQPHINPPQTELTGMQYCVLYVKDRREHRTPWFKSKERAKVALQVMQRKYGKAIIYMD